MLCQNNDTFIRYVVMTLPLDECLVFYRGLPLKLELIY